jgi:glycosyltransferase involved in cell wall biosynthesis
MQENAALKKKILYVITKGNFGGAQRYVYDLATNLSKSDFDTVAVCGNKDGDLLPKKLAERNIRTIILENSEREINIRNDFKTFRELLKIIKEEKPNIIHLNSSKIGLLGALAILFLKFSSIIHNSKFIIHSVFTSHGWAFNEQNRSFTAKLIFYVAHYLTVLICNSTIAVSEKTKKDIAFLPLIEEKIRVIHNGVENFETLPKDESLKILGVKNSEQAKTILFTLSELHYNKGIDVALKAISILPKDRQENIIYCIAGGGEEKENLEKLASDLGIKNLVRFLGFVEDGKKLLSGATIFLFPSRTENLPFAILEAGFKGLPIISTCVGGNPEIIKDMQNGILVHPNNSKETAEAILYLLDHPEKREEFGGEIKKTVLNFFSLEKMLGETIKLYQ